MLLSRCYSRWEDHSLHLCSKTVHAGCPRTRLLSDPILVTDASRQKEAVRSDRWRLWVLHPIHYAQAKQAWHSGPIDRYLFRSPSSHRPHVSLSGALPPAFASWASSHPGHAVGTCSDIPRAPGWLSRSDRSFSVAVGSLYPPGLVGVNTSRFARRWPLSLTLFRSRLLNAREPVSSHDGSTERSLPLSITTCLQIWGHRVCP